MANYQPNGFQIIPAIWLDDTGKKVLALQLDGTYKWVHNANTTSPIESLIWNTDGTISISALLAALATYTRAGLPTPSTPGRVVLVTNDVRGLWVDNGTAWGPVDPTVITTNFSGASPDARLAAAIASVGSTSTLFVVPSVETTGGLTTTALATGQSLLDLRNTGSAGQYFFYKGKSGSSQAIRVDWVGGSVDSGNAIAIYGNAENAGNGTNVLGVFGKVNSNSSAGVYGFNSSTGPGVQGDGSANAGARGILGTSGSSGTGGTPSIAIQGDGLGGYGIGGRFQSDGGLPLDIRGLAQAVNQVANFETASTNGTALQVRNTDTGGKNWWLVSAGSATPVGVGKFAIYNQNNNFFPFYIDAAAPTNSLVIQSDGGLTLNSPTGGSRGAGTINTAAAQYQNGTPASTITLKTGSGAGDYTTASASYTDVDGTNLAFTVTIPSGFKLLVNATAVIKDSTLAAAVGFAITDGSVVAEEVIDAAVVGDREAVALTHAITGDGASHTVKLQWKTSAGTATMGNSSSTLSPRLTFFMAPSA